MSRLSKWDIRMVMMAKVVASWSKDPVRKVGAVIASNDFRKIAVGFNGFPRGIEDSPERLINRETKNYLTVHAERNALDNAGFNVEGCSMYLTRFPCMECAKGIVQKGIYKVVAERPPLDNPRWSKSWSDAMGLMREAGIIVITYSQLTSLAKWQLVEDQDAFRK